MNYGIAFGSILRGGSEADCCTRNFQIRSNAEGRHFNWSHVYKKLLVLYKNNFNGQDIIAISKCSLVVVLFAYAIRKYR